MSSPACVFFSPSSRDELRPPTERLIPPPAAGAHGRVPAHEDAQEDPGTPVVRVLRDLRQDGTTHLHGKGCSGCVCIRGVCVCVCVDLWNTSHCWRRLCVFRCLRSLFKVISVTLLGTSVSPVRVESLLACCVCLLQAVLPCACIPGCNSSGRR